LPFPKFMPYRPQAIPADFSPPAALELAAVLPVVRSHGHQERIVGFLQNVIRTAVISALGAKMARGRSPIVAALIALLVSRALSGRADEGKPAAGKSAAEGGEGGLGDLIDRFRQGGLEDIIKSWIGTGPNKAVSPNQLHQALGAETIDRLSAETGLPRDDLLSQLSRALPEVIDKLTPDGKLPKEADLLPGAEEMVAARR
jgi:uncharacterized protein YidB (DUF937 family)